MLPKSLPSSKKFRHCSDGYIFLMSVLIIGAMLMATSMSLLLLSWANEQNGVTFAEAARALSMARSCAEQALPKLQTSLTYAGGEKIALPNGSCSVKSVQGSGAFYRTICAEGVSGRVTRRIRLDVQTLFPSIVISGYTEMTSLSECGGVAALSSSSSTSSGSAASAGSSASSLVSIATTSTTIVFDVSSTGSITPLSGLTSDETNAVLVSGTSAILASPVSARELRLVDAENPRALSLTQTKSGPSIGLSLARGKGQVLLGSQKSSTSGNGRFRLWRMDSDGIPSSPGPWDYTTSGSVLEIAADPTGCYAFVTTNWAAQGFQVVKIKNEVMTAVSNLAVSASTLGTPTGLLNNPAIDRVYLLTQKGFTILGPTSTTPSCP